MESASTAITNVQGVFPELLRELIDVGLEVKVCPITPLLSTQRTHAKRSNATTSLRRNSV